MKAYAQTAVQHIREAVGEKGTVLLALSGGVDSSVAAALIYKAIGDRLTCVYVDHGFMRKGESEQVAEVFGKTFPVRFVPVDASEEFLADLRDVSDPEQKRKIIGRDFIRVFKREAEKLGKLDYFAQGTIYPDVIESGQATGAAVIKSHHNVGGLPKELGFTELIEPLRMLFKDEVRKAGLELGIPENLVFRQPFPGPGLQGAQTLEAGAAQSKEQMQSILRWFHGSGGETASLCQAQCVISIHFLCSFPENPKISPYSKPAAGHPHQPAHKESRSCRHRDRYKAGRPAAVPAGP